MKTLLKVIIPFICILFSSCNTEVQKQSSAASAKGKLFIIGGGTRPPELIRDMIREAGIGANDYVLVFAMSSEGPDDSYDYFRGQMEEEGITGVSDFCYVRGDSLSAGRLDSIRSAPMIYFPGGSQSRFMETVTGSPLPDAFRKAYENGALLAGTSAGAAIMSRKMITGDQVRYPEYTGNFPTIESENIVLSEGLGLLDRAIIDQHFIRRMRLNRLISVVLENPDDIAIGIDESTAICVHGDSAKVYGTGQVIVLRHHNDTTRIWNGLLGGRNLEMDVLLPGEKFAVR